MVITLIQPVLGLRKKTDADLESYASGILNQLVPVETQFPGLKPSCTDVQDFLTDYSGNLAKVKHGTPADTSAKNQSRLRLENALRAQAQSAAEIAGDDETKFLLTGYGIKASGRPSGIISAPSKLTVELGPLEGTLYAKFRAVKNAYSYEIFYGPYSQSPEQWTKYMVTTAGKILIGEMQSGIMYGVRVRSIGAKGKTSDWTNIVTKKTY